MIDSLEKISQEKKETWLEYVKDIRTRQAISEKQAHNVRREIRKTVHQLRKGHGPDNGLREHFERQFPENNGLETQAFWNRFTHDWDIGINDPLKIIYELDWNREGGEYDELGNKFPTAFTKQEYDN